MAAGGVIIAFRHWMSVARLMVFSCSLLMGGAGAGQGAGSWSRIPHLMSREDRSSVELGSCSDPGLIISEDIAAAALSSGHSCTDTAPAFWSAAASAAAGWLLV